MSNKTYSTVCNAEPAVAYIKPIESTEPTDIKSKNYVSKKTPRNNDDNTQYNNENKQNRQQYNGGGGDKGGYNQRQNGGYNQRQNGGYNQRQNGGYNQRYDNSGDNQKYDNQRYDNSGENRQQNGGYNRRQNGGYRKNNKYNDNRQEQDNYDEQNQQEQQSTKVDSKVDTKVDTKVEPTPEELIALKESDIAKREQCMIPIESFDDLLGHLDLKIIRGVMAYGFEEPSPIQKKAIKPLLGKFDLIAQAQSGTGKTATFCIGTLGNIDFTKNETQAIIVAHTMELAQQIEHVFANIGKYIDVRLALAVKTMSVRENIDVIMGKNNDGLLPHVVIGTPGRMLDMIAKKIIDANTIKVLILDEADELLSEGFIMQIKQIISSINENTQIGLFSATMDTSFFKMTEKFLRNPINILINKENLTLDGIKQYNIECEKNEWKFETLCDLYSLFSTSQTIIYCNYHQSVEILTKKLQEKNFKVSLIHGGMDIMEREEAMKKFRNLQTRVLISTDLLGRGIDVQQVSIVINYDIPFKNESYIHRIGRSGRHGRKGTAINLITNNDVRRIEEIAKYYKTTILPLPSDLESVFQNN